MRFQPKTEKEIAELNLLPKGEYAFEIIESEEMTSKKGSPMLVLTLKIYDQQLQPCGRVRDYLLESMPHKLRHAAYGCGLGQHYEKGVVEAGDFLHTNGTVKLGIQIDKTGQYPDKNFVTDYIESKEPQNRVPRTRGDEPQQPLPTPKSFGDFRDAPPPFSEEDIPF